MDNCQWRLEAVAARYSDELQACRHSSIAARGLVKNSLCQFVYDLGRTDRIRKRNDENPFISLPIAALCNVFASLGFLDRLAISQVSHRLRRRLNDHPELWADAREIISEDAWLDPTRQLVERSRDAPLKLGLKVYPRDIQQCEAAFAIVSQNLPRLTELCVSFSRAHDSGEDRNLVHLRGWSALNSAIAGPAQALERLRIDLCYDCCPITLLVPQDILGGHAPRLRVLKLSAALPSEGCPAFACVTTFNYTPTDSELDHAGLSALLRSMQRLHTLRLHIHTFTTYANDDEASVEWAPLASSSLRNVHVNWICDGLREFLACIACLDVQRIALDDTWSEPGWNGLLEIFPHVQHLSIGKGVCEVEALRACGTSITLRFRSGSGLGVYDLLAMRQTYDNLTSLDFHEFLWPREVPFPEAASLSSLRILLASCYDIRSLPDRWLSIFQAVGATAWSVPSLRTLHLSYWLSGACESRYPRKDPPGRCGCAPTLNVSLADIHSFVSRCLRYSRPRLVGISLSGVEVIDVEPFAWLQRLELLAEELTIERTPKPISSDAPPGVWSGDFQDVLQDRIVYNYC